MLSSPYYAALVGHWTVRIWTPSGTMADYGSILLALLAALFVVAADTGENEMPQSEEALLRLVTNLRGSATYLESTSQDLLEEADVRFQDTVATAELQSPHTRASMMSCAWDHLANATLLSTHVLNVSLEVKELVTKLNDGLALCDRQSSNFFKNTICKINQLRKVWSDVFNLRDRGQRLLHELRVIVDSFNSCVKDEHSANSTTTMSSAMTSTTSSNTTSSTISSTNSTTLPSQQNVTTEVESMAGVAAPYDPVNFDGDDLIAMEDAPEDVEYLDDFEDQEENPLAA